MYHPQKKYYIRSLSIPFIWQHAKRYMTQSYAQVECDDGEAKERSNKSLLKPLHTR
jgi:hypothetical protein